MTATTTRRWVPWLAVGVIVLGIVVVIPSLGMFGVLWTGM